jgi:hypothetical protein
LWHIFQGGEATIKDLLLAAHPVQRHNLDGTRIVQVCWRIVEGEVTVRANAEQDEIDRSLGQKRCVVRACSFRIDSGIDWLEANGGEVMDELVREPVCEALWRILSQPDVLVHVEGRDALPVDGGLTAKRGEHLALAWGRCQNQAKVVLAAQAFSQCVPYIASRQQAKLGAGLCYMNFHDVP